MWITIIPVPDLLTAHYVCRLISQILKLCMFRGLTRFVFLRFLLPGPKHTSWITSASSSPSPAFGRIWEVAMMKKSRHFLHLTKMWASFLLPGLQPVYESVLAVWWKIWPDRVTTFQDINGYKMAIWSQNCPNTTMTSFWHRNNQRVVRKTPDLGQLS